MTFSYVYRSLINVRPGLLMHLQYVASQEDTLTSLI